MQEINRLTGRNYRLFEYYGAPDAERVIILMGSAAETAKEAVDYLTAKGEKVGLVNVHLYRPFSAEHLLSAIPQTCRKIAVLDRPRSPAHGRAPVPGRVHRVSEQRYPHDHRGRPVRSLLQGHHAGPAPGGVQKPESGNAQAQLHRGHRGRCDEHLSACPGGDRHRPTGQTSAEFWGMGSDGTVGANKNSIKIIGHATDLYCQAYFVYDSKKSGGLTQSHLRFGKAPIRSPYLIPAADFVAPATPPPMSTSTTW